MSIPISFGSASLVKTGGGRGPVAINSSGQVVVVMLTDTQIVYTVGSCDPSSPTVKFGNSTLPVYTWGNVAVSNFDVAMDPNGNQVVVVLQIGGGKYQLYYITGTLNGTTITWNTAVNYDTGMNPSVTVCTLNNALTVIEVHNTESGPQENLYYHMGTLNGATISNFVQKGTKFQAFQYAILGTSCWMTPSYWLLVTVTGGPTGASQVQYYTEATYNPFENRATGFVADGQTSDVVLAPQGAFEVHTPGSGVSPNLNNIFLTQGTLEWQTTGAIEWDGTGDNTNIVGGFPYIAAAGQFLVLTYMALPSDGNTDVSGNTMAVYSLLP